MSLLVRFLTIFVLSASPACAVVIDDFIRFESDIGPFLSEGDLEAIVMLEPFTPEQLADPDGEGVPSWHQHASFFTGTGERFELASYLLHVSIEFFVVDHGDHLVWGPGLGGFPDSPFPKTDDSFVPDDTFYLGVIGQGSFFPITDPSGNRIVTGWAEVRRIEPELIFNPETFKFEFGPAFEVVQSAVSFQVNEGGIIVGTRIAIPEPTSSILTGLAFMAAARRSR